MSCYYKIKYYWIKVNTKGFVRLGGPTPRSEATYPAQCNCHQTASVWDHHGPDSTPTEPIRATCTAGRTSPNGSWPPSATVTSAFTDHIGARAAEKPDPVGCEAPSRSGTRAVGDWRTYEYV